METFDKSYIEKCIKYHDHIEYLIDRSRGMYSSRNIEVPRYYFQIGDFFHCPDLMDDLEVKAAKFIINQITISAGVPYQEYPIDECIYIPTEAQLAEGFSACSLNMGTDAYGKGPEKLLDRYIEFLNQNKPEKFD